MNIFNGFISRLDIAEDRFSEFDNMTREISKTEKQRENRLELTKEQIIQNLE